MAIELTNHSALGNLPDESRPAVARPTAAQEGAGAKPAAVQDGGSGLVDTAQATERLRAAQAEQRAEETRREEKAEEQGNVLQLREAVEKLNALPQLVNRDLMFVVDDTLGSTVIKVIKSDTEEVIRQIPSEEALARMKYFEGVEGLIFRSKA